MFKSFPLLLFLSLLVAASMAAGAAHAVPDPGKGATLSPATGVDRQSDTNRGRPTGNAEHAMIGGPETRKTGRAKAGGASARSDVVSSGPVAVSAATRSEAFDWLAAAIGALTAMSVIGIASTAVVIHRRGSRVQTAVRT